MESMAATFLHYNQHTGISPKSISLAAAVCLKIFFFQNQKLFKVLKHHENIYQY